MGTPDARLLPDGLPGYRYRDQFYVEGLPIAQPRPRAYRRGARAGVYDPGTAEAWKQGIARAARPRLPWGGFEDPYRVDLVFLFKRPERLARVHPDRWLPHVSKPDLDNAEKAVLDALTGCGAWADDSQVMSLRAVKFYGRPGESPGLIVTIYTMDEEA